MVSLGARKREGMPTLDEIRGRVAAELGRPPELPRQLNPEAGHSVTVTDALVALWRRSAAGVRRAA